MDQTEETFLASLTPKAQAVVHLDHVTQELCPNLRFVSIHVNQMVHNSFPDILWCFHQCPVVAEMPVKVTTGWQTQLWRGYAKGEDVKGSLLWLSSGEQLVMYYTVLVSSTL